MRKFGVFTSFVFIAIIVAGVYGILHDQITYSISPEYFTKFKYKQFGFEPEWFGGHRATVAVIGFLATWWMGLFIGILLGLLSFIFSTHTIMLSTLRKAVLLVLAITVIAGVAGYLYGSFYLAVRPVNWWMPEDLSDKNAFIIVGSMHNFSYAGGLAAACIAVVYIFKTYKVVKAKQNTDCLKESVL
nr:hypothetical protein [uncultured Lacibacter sp.]